MRFSCCNIIATCVYLPDLRTFFLSSGVQSTDIVLHSFHNIRSLWACMIHLHVQCILMSQDFSYIRVHTYTYTCTCYVPALNYFLQSECLRPPADDCLRQMSGLVEGHRNGVLGPPLTEWLKNLIRAHCSGCRDPECKVPHLAVGW